MPIDLTKVNFDSPAFGSEAATITNEPKETATAQPSQGESGDEKGTKDTVIEPAPGGTKPAVNDDDDNQKVPYSRLQSVIEARREAERRAEEAESRLAQLESQGNRQTSTQSTHTPSPHQGNLPDYWVKLYGDSAESREAFSYELERQNEIREAARQDALEAVRQERNNESQVLADNEKSIENRLEDLSLTLGRDLNNKEKSALLDIVDEYTPKDNDGNYAGDLIPFDKAWEIYELRQSQATSKTTRARQTPTALTGTRTESEQTDTERDNKDWNPLDWNGWRKRVPNA